jgi:hypothetical protein
MGTSDWIKIAILMENKTLRQCMERWTNYVDPRLKKANWTAEDDAALHAKLAELWTKWKVIMTFFSGRSKNFLKTKYFAMRKAMKGIAIANEKKEASPAQEVRSVDLMELFRMEMNGDSKYFQMDDDGFYY